MGRPRRRAVKRSRPTLRVAIKPNSRRNTHVLPGFDHLQSRYTGLSASWTGTKCPHSWQRDQFSDEVYHGGAYFLHDKRPNESLCLKIPDLDVSILTARIDGIVTTDNYTEDGAVGAHEGVHNRRAAGSAFPKLFGFSNT